MTCCVASAQNETAFSPSRTGLPLSPPLRHQEQLKKEIPIILPPVVLDVYEVGGQPRIGILANGNPISLIDPFGLCASESGFSSWLTGVGQVWQGYGDSAVAAANGVAYAVSDDAYLAAWDAVFHPVQTATSAYDSVVNGIANTYNNLFGTDSRAQGQAMGNILITAGSAAAPFASAGSEASIVGQNFGKLGTGVESPGQTITGFTDHGFTQADVRGLTWDTMQNTVQQPAAVLQQSAGQYLYVSPNAAVVLNPAGQIMTTYPSSMFGPNIQAVLKAASGGH